jgi:hypothetical protein
MRIRLATVGDVAGVAALVERARPFYERHGFSRRAGYELLDKPLQDNLSRR